MRWLVISQRIFFMSMVFGMSQLDEHAGDRRGLYGSNIIKDLN